LCKASAPAADRSARRLTQPPRLTGAPDIVAAAFPFRRGRFFAITSVARVAQNEAMDAAKRDFFAW
jgi:hypothetical protein